MSKLHVRGYVAISTIAAALALLVAVPAGADAAEESGGSTSGEAAAESPSEWTPPSGEGETSSGGGNASLVHGSSVGSGTVEESGGGSTEKTGSDSAEPAPAPPPPDPAVPYESESTPSPSTPGESASAPPPAAVVQPVRPVAPAPVAKAGAPVDVAVGAATSLGHPASAQGDGAASTPPPVAAAFTDSGDRASMGSYALPLLIVLVLGLILGYAGVRFRRRRERGRLEVLWREQDAAWEAALRRGEIAQAPEASVSTLSSGGSAADRVSRPAEAA